MKIAIMAGGISPERNVSLASGLAVMEALSNFDYELCFVDPALGADCLIELNKVEAHKEEMPTDEALNLFKPSAYIDCVMSDALNDVDLVFLALHGKYGEDGYIQSLLELRDIKYTGSRRVSSALAMDKNLSKRIFESARIMTPAWMTLTEQHADQHEILNEVINYLGKELVVKPNDQGSTVGVTILMHAGDRELGEAVKKASRYSDLVVVEQYIPGREITVGVLDGMALPIVEIVTHEGYYDYEHKYTSGTTDYICPADFDENMEEFIQGMAVLAHDVLGCSGATRVDFRVDDDGQVFCLELNTIPGLTSLSLLPTAAKEKGANFNFLCYLMVKSATSKKLDAAALENGDED